MRLWFWRFLGLGEDHHSVAWSKLHYDTAKGGTDGHADLDWENAPTSNNVPKITGRQ